MWREEASAPQHLSLCEALPSPSLWVGLGEALAWRPGVIVALALTTKASFYFFNCREACVTQIRDLEEPSQRVRYDCHQQELLQRGE